MGPRLHPLYGIGGVQFLRFLVFLCILRFRISKSLCSQRFKVEVVGN